ncbi:MAG: diguanylate cyclase [Helicobacteraceae bacterium]|nr:diguanylate cyclase [Helicobacteraceae bacterium]
MIKINELELKNLICNETSSFAISVVDIESSEVVYKNNAMKFFMIDESANKCWESIYGQSSRCSWCGIKNKLDSNTEEIYEYETEHFNEKTNKWYQIQNKVTKLEDGRAILVSIALDISTQKEAQGQFITTQVKLVQQAKELEKAQEKLKLLALLDPLTKLYNRRYLTKISENMLDLSKREKQDLSIIILDIDKFKNVNDTYGHQVGDDVIVTLSNKLIEQQRKSDIICRYGGEEFVILLPNTSVEGAAIVAEKIRQDIEALVIKLEVNKELKISASLGISQIDVKKENNIELALKRADKALYKAKGSGRNRICTI